MKQLNSKRNLVGTMLAVLVFAAAAWAADKAAPAKGSMELQQPASVAGTQLTSGKYRVEWTPNGDLVDVKFYRGDKQVASTTARLVKVDVAPYDRISYTTDEKGARSLTQLSFNKQQFALRLSSEPADAERAAK